MPKFAFYSPPWFLTITLDHTFTFYISVCAVSSGNLLLTCMQKQISKAPTLLFCWPEFKASNHLLWLHNPWPTSDRTKVRTLVDTSDMRSCMKKRTRNGSYTGRLSWKQHGGYIFQILECYKSSSFVMESMESMRLK